MALLGKGYYLIDTFLVVKYHGAALNADLTMNGLSIHPSIIAIVVKQRILLMIHGLLHTHVERNVNDIYARDAVTNVSYYAIQGHVLHVQ